MKPTLTFIFALLCSIASSQSMWTPKQANDWYAKQPWLVGCNFVPSNAINQLEMWQPETFDLATIDKELALAKGLGFNSVRVFLHDLLWEQDAKGFLSRIDQFLGVADKHGIGVMIVLFDGVWDPDPKLGKQRDPKPHTHNSGWVQSPARDILKDPSRHETLAPYVKGVIGRFKDDRRVQVWDIYNEPDNTNLNSYGVKSKAKTELPDEQKKAMSLALITKGFGWAREVNPSQPITSGVWAGSWKTLDAMSPMARFCAEQSDVITFHSYDPPEQLEARIKQLLPYNRPILCTEYMARGNGSTFEGSLPMLKKYGVGAINWVLVQGKAQTHLPWDSWRRPYVDREPAVWFHEVFRNDGTPYDPKETALIKSLTAAVPAGR